MRKIIKDFEVNFELKNKQLYHFTSYDTNMQHELAMALSYWITADCIFNRT